MNDKIEWVLVPRGPTEAMDIARRMYGDTSDWWNAVVAAAPKPEAQAAGVDALPEKWRRRAQEERVDDAGELIACTLDSCANELQVALSTPASHDAQQPEAAGALAEKGVTDAMVYEGCVAYFGVQHSYSENALKMARRIIEGAISAAPVAAQQPAVVGDGVRLVQEARASIDHAINGEPGEWCDWLTQAHDKLTAAIAALTPAATPGDGEALLRIALADAYSHGEKHAPFAMEDCVRKVMAAQKEGNGNGR